MIEIKDLHKKFEGTEVLRGAELTVKKGETLVIIGRSGCGKSVMLKHIVGLIEPDKGTVLIDGNDIFSFDPKQWQHMRLKVGMLFQGAALFDSLTVGENVGFSLTEHTTIPLDEVREIVSEKLALVGLSGIENLKPAELSGGMKKRVGLARAICNDPEIMLYDEPTTGLDPIMADAINDLIKELNTKLKVTSIVVTHDMASAYKVADRIAMLYEGTIIESGTPEEIRATANPIVKQFITGSADGPITHNNNGNKAQKSFNQRVRKWIK
jgi:phospholipid/cholesterol/gamma-HCH transport system ATP-binding protein